MTTDELLREIASLPVEERALVADSVLRGLNPPDPEIDAKWARVSRKRLASLQSSERKAIPGEEVFSEIWKHRGT